MINMKAPGDTRPTWRNGVLQIHITRACDESCTSCTQGSNLAGKPVMMTIENFEIAASSLRDYYGVVGIFGGNPTLHPQFEEICRIFQRVIPFEQRGLWSNNLRGYGKLCREVFNPSISNLNVHTSQASYDEMKRDWPECNPIGLDHDSRHSPPFVAIKDVISERAEQIRLIEDCDINKYWSAMICQFRGNLRGFFCELAGAQSMLYEKEIDYPDTGLEIKKGWWKLGIDHFQHQIEKHCFECGIPLKLAGDLALGWNEYVSDTHKEIVKSKRPGKIIHFVKDTKDLAKVGRATDYIQNGINKMKNRVLIGVPTMNFSRNDSFYDHFLQIDKPEGTIQTFARGQSPARNRNIIIGQAIEHDCSHILFLDDDTTPPKDILTKLMMHNKDIVTGLYLMRNFPHKPIIFDWADEKGRCLTHYLNEVKYNAGLIPIKAAGLGACLIKIEVFKRMPSPWITLGELEPDHWCDDISFYRRALALGFEAFCDLDVRVGHFTQATVTPEFVNGNWCTTIDTAGTQKVVIPQMGGSEAEEKLRATN